MAHPSTFSWDETVGEDRRSKEGGGGRDGEEGGRRRRRREGGRKEGDQEDRQGATETGVGVMMLQEEHKV